MIAVDIIFALTSICDELFQLRLHFLDRFLLFNMHGENDLSCDYNVHHCAVKGSGDIDPRYRRRIIAAAIAIGVGCKKEGGVSFFLEKDEERG